MSKSRPNKPIALKIAADLFTSGDGKHADRLIFHLPSGEDWGGWSEPAVASRIEDLIDAEKKSKP